jgi:hypothetical protein
MDIFTPRTKAKAPLTRLDYAVGAVAIIAAIAVALIVFAARGGL